MKVLSAAIVLAGILAFACTQSTETKGASAAEPSAEYLPPAAEYLPPADSTADPSFDTKLADDGYRYRTVRRQLKLRTRHRRDVSEREAPAAAPGTEVTEPSKDYLPPAESTDSAAEVRTAVGDDGYRYKTVRRLRYRRHRREVDAGEVKAAEAPVNEYLPPAAEESVTEAIAEEAGDVKPAVKSAELAADGYRYKTVRKLKYRHRH